MLLTTAAAFTVLLLGFTFFVRKKDLPQAAGVTPWQHLEGRKAAIYENLRDLQFEYRVGKLSDDDYQRSKKELQAELAGVLAEIDDLKAGAPSAASNGTAAVKDNAPAGAGAKKCPHCGAKFDKALKFCGECGKPMGVSA
jgi:hypothetical protein